MFKQRKTCKNTYFLASWAPKYVKTHIFICENTHFLVFKQRKTCKKHAFLRVFVSLELSKYAFLHVFRRPGRQNYAFLRFSGRRGRQKWVFSRVSIPRGIKSRFSWFFQGFKKNRSKTKSVQEFSFFGQNVGGGHTMAPKCVFFCVFGCRAAKMCIFTGFRPPQTPKTCKIAYFCSPGRTETRKNA